MMVSQEIFAHDSIDSMERKKRKLVNNFFIATEKAISSKQHGTFVQLASLAKKSGFTNSEISSNIGLKKINDNKFAQVNHHATQQKMLHEWERIQSAQESTSSNKVRWTEW